MKFCPECGTKVESEAQKFCGVCGGNLQIATENPSQKVESVGLPAMVSRLSLLEQELVYKQRRKLFWYALLLNALWAGAGNFYAGLASSGGILCIITFFGWLFGLLSWAVGGPIVFLSFLVSSIMCYNRIELLNQRLRISIAKGESTY